MIRLPTHDILGIYESILDIMQFLKDLPAFEIKDVELNAVANDTLQVHVSSNKITQLKGMVQISGTSDELPTIIIRDNSSATLTYSFGASTSGRQQYRYLLVGV